MTGIFARKDIAKGVELTYDYQFDTSDPSKCECYCGAPCCRGTMAAPKKARDEKRRAARRTLAERPRTL